MPPLLFLTPSLPLPRHRTPPHLTPTRPTCATSPLPPLTPLQTENAFSRLTHVNPNLRKQASSQLAHSPTPAILYRLVALLDLDDVAHRRAAVQALAMTGLTALPPVVELLRASENRTVRASCAKVVAALALYFPKARAAFSEPALDVLEGVLGGDPDPVTKLATVGALGTLGSDVGGEDPVRGCERAVAILMHVCRSTTDMAVGATAVGAVAQIAQNGSAERKQSIVEQLREIAEREEEGEEDGMQYMKEIAAGHVEQLTPDK